MNYTEHENLKRLKIVRAGFTYNPIRVIDMLTECEHLELTDDEIRMALDIFNTVLDHGNDGAYLHRSTTAVSYLVRYGMYLARMREQSGVLNTENTVCEDGELESALHI